VPDTPSLSAIAESIPGRVGFCAVHLEAGRWLELNADERFPMASLMKLGLAVHVLRRVERGELNLRAWVLVRPDHWRTGAGLLGQFVHGAPARLPASRLLALSLQESDNTATDALLEWSGGVAAVHQELDSMGFGSLAPERSILELVGDLRGIHQPGPTRAEWAQSVRQASRVPKAEAAERFARDRRDCATPRELVRFLDGLWRGDLLRPRHRRRLFGLLSGARTGQERIPAGAPAGSWVAHKTGSFPGRYAADAGLIRLTDGSHLILSAHVWSAEGDLDGVIARLTSAAIRTFRQELREPYPG
jgi:beta-lactamase class A